MPTNHLSILVVDDAKFSSAMIGRALSQAGYQNVRFASSASEALQLLEREPVSVLLADWLMPEMDGLELTARVRQLDESGDHYTYIMLLTGKEGDNALAEAFDRGVDDFVSKTAMSEQLVPRVLAATVVALALSSSVTLVGLTGSFFFAVFVQHATPGAFAASLTLLIGLPEVIIALVKAALFGLAASLIACYKGMSVGGGPAGVGNAVNETVVYAFMALFLINVIATAVGVKATM